MRDYARQMLGSRFVVAFWAGLLLCCACGVGQERVDLSRAISRAKSEVFPALIFVKPIVADYGSGEKKQQEVFGSGVIIDPGGYAVTNWHVVDKAVTINCVLDDKRQVEAQLIGSDRDTDLALLKLPEPAEGQTYPHARFADTTRLQAGDILLTVGDRAVDGIYAEMLPAIWCTLANLEIDQTVSMQFQRGAETSRVSVTPEEKGALEGEDLDCRRWNMTVKEINKYRTPRLYFLRQKGVYIQGVRRPGNASSSGLSRRDIILKIDNKPVETIENVRDSDKQRGVVGCRWRGRWRRSRWRCRCGSSGGGSRSAGRLK